MVIVLFLRANTGQREENWVVCWPASLQVGIWVSKACLDYPTERPAMPRMTRLPEAVARLFAPLKPHFGCVATLAGVVGSLKRP